MRGLPTFIIRNSASDIAHFAYGEAVNLASAIEIQNRID
jgi:hypothetical protein